MMKSVFPLLVVLLTACTPTSKPVGPPLSPPDNGLVEREPDSCGAGNLQHLIGQNEGMIRTVRTKGAYRVISPGAIVTQEYDSFRLGVFVDDAGTILKLACG